VCRHSFGNRRGTNFVGLLIPTVGTFDAAFLQSSFIVG